MYTSYSTEIVCALSTGNMYFFIRYFFKRDLIKSDGITPPLKKPQGQADKNVMKHLYSVCEVFS
jgi:hypothetical protein